MRGCFLFPIIKIAETDILGDEFRVCPFFSLFFVVSNSSDGIFPKQDYCGDVYQSHGTHCDICDPPEKVGVQDGSEKYHERGSQLIPDGERSVRLTIEEVEKALFHVVKISKQCGEGEK